MRIDGLYRIPFWRFIGSIENKLRETLGVQGLSVGFGIW